jgi:beta-xylosidase
MSYTTTNHRPSPSRRKGVSPLSSSIRHSLPSILALLLCSALRAEPRDTYQNPLDVIIADPFALKHDDTYYLYGTTVASYGFQVFSSKNLIDWRNHGFIYQRSKDSWGRNKFWAPECFRHDGKFYFHYTAAGEAKSLRVHLAVADTPLGPFKDIKNPWLDPGQAVIDTHVFKDADGQLYLYYVIDCSENKFSEIRVCKLSDDLTPSAESAFCARPSQPWEGETWNEGPFVLKHKDTYYLVYSGNAFFDEHYGLGYATAPTPMGPWTKFANNPILQKTPGAAGPGHNGFIESPDCKELFAVYHTLQNPGFNAARQLAADRVRFVPAADKSAPDVLVIDGPTTNPQPFPAGAKPVTRAESDDFSSPDIDHARWTIFNENPKYYSLTDGRLVIRTTDGDIAERRDDQDNLFLQYAPRSGDFEVTTRVNIDLKVDYQNAFLILWQDHDNFIKLAAVHDQRPHLEVAVETNATYKSQLFENPLGPDLHLRITRKNDHYSFAASNDGKTWTTLKSDVPATLTDLRVGLGAASPGTKEPTTASFDYLRFTTISPNPAK